MKVYRVTTLTALACVAGLSLAACSGGISTVAQSPTTSAPPTSSVAATSAATSSTAASSAPAATSSSSVGVFVSDAPASSTSSTVTLGGGIGTFPIPPGASVIEDGNSGSNGGYSIAFSGVTATEVTTFYTASLPSYGYTITQNDAASGTSVTGTTIKFTGRGFNGDIGGMSGTGSIGGVSLGSTTSGGVTGVTFTPA